MSDPIPTQATTGLVLHSAARYDLMLWLFTLGREKALRQMFLRLARLERGESVLDVGCGTGTLAIAAKQQVGAAGAVCGLDASPEMIVRARKKAKRAGVEVAFKQNVAEEMPFPDAKFDVVLITVMLHHLPQNARKTCALEIKRVLKPGGRVLAVDFLGSGKTNKGFFRHFHRRHGYVNVRDMIALLNEAGLNTIESGDVGIYGLQFVLASARCCN